MGAHSPAMGLPDKAVTLTPAQVEELSKKLSDVRHNVNNFLALIIAAAELIKRKPDTTARMVDTMAEQPAKIIEEMQKFSKEFERILTIHRD